MLYLSLQPWTGFSVARFLDVKPPPEGTTYVEFTSWDDTSVSKVQNQVGSITLAIANCQSLLAFDHARCFAYHYVHFAMHRSLPVLPFVSLPRLGLHLAVRGGFDKRTVHFCFPVIPFVSLPRLGLQLAVRGGFDNHYLHCYLTLTIVNPSFVSLPFATERSLLYSITLASNRAGATAGRTSRL
jgi:hypothetical protein